MAGRAAAMVRWWDMAPLGDTDMGSFPVQGSDGRGAATTTTLRGREMIKLRAGRGKEI